MLRTPNTLHPSSKELGEVSQCFLVSLIFISQQSHGTDMGLGIHTPLCPIYTSWTLSYGPCYPVPICCTTTPDRGLRGLNTIKEAPTEDYSV